MSKNLLIGLIALLGTASCGSQLSTIKSNDYNADNYNDSIAFTTENPAEAKELLVRELGYSHQGVQSNGKVVGCKIIHDDLDETALELKVEAEYMHSRGKSEEVFQRVTKNSVFNPNAQLLCIEFPVTLQELEQKQKSHRKRHEQQDLQYENKRREKLLQEEEKRNETLFPSKHSEEKTYKTYADYCEVAYAQAIDSCNGSDGSNGSIKTNSAAQQYKLCTSERNAVKSKLYWQFNDEKVKQCMPDGKRTNAELDYCVDKLAVIYGQHGSIAKQADERYNACVEPVKAVYDACVAGAQKSLEECKKNLQE